MTEFSVELVGGPHAGRRTLKSRRRRLPEEVPVLVKTDRPAEQADSDHVTAVKTFAIYRYSHRDTSTERFVYTYDRQREESGRPSTAGVLTTSVAEGSPSTGR